VIQGRGRKVSPFCFVGKVNGDSVDVETSVIGLMIFRVKWSWLSC